MKIVYKVKYSTVALMPDGSHGNVAQSTGQVVYTDFDLADIPGELNQQLLKSSKVAVISEIARVDGRLIKAGGSSF